MQYLEVSGAVRPLKWPLGVKWLKELSVVGDTRVGSVLFPARDIPEHRSPIRAERVGVE